MVRTVETADIPAAYEEIRVMDETYFHKDLDKLVCVGMDARYFPDSQSHVMVALFEHVERSKHSFSVYYVLNGTVKVLYQVRSRGSASSTSIIPSVCIVETNERR